MTDKPTWLHNWAALVADNSSSAVQTVSARALSCCRHCTRLSQEHVTTCVRTCVSEGTLIGHEQRPWPCHALGSSSANVRSASPPREHATVFLPICAPHWTMLRSKRTWRPEDFFLFRESYSTFWFNSFNSFNLCSASLSIFIFGVLYFFVIGLVGLCCKPQPFVIIIITQQVALLSLLIK